MMKRLCRLVTEHDALVEECCVNARHDDCCFDVSNSLSFKKTNTILRRADTRNYDNNVNKKVNNHALDSSK